MLYMRVPIGVPSKEPIKEPTKEPLHGALPEGDRLCWAFARRPLQRRGAESDESPGSRCAKGPSGLFRVWGLGFRVWGLGFGVFRVEAFGMGPSGLY